MSVRVSDKMSAKMNIRALAMIGVTVCAGLALVGCGQRGALYMPGSTPPQSKHAHFIFGSDISSSNSTVSAPPKAKAVTNPAGVARPYVPGPVMGEIRDDPTANNATITGSITVDPVGSAS